MKLEQHEEAYKEHLNNIKRLIDEGIEENQRNIGYNVSQGSIELFAIYLHKLHLIQGSGDQFDHRVFKNQNLIREKVPPEFPKRIKILELMKNIEEERIALCYGNRKTKERIEKAIKNFNELREIINQNLKNGK
ncbi:MAG: hypothetical protein Q7S74_05125 [Nanoarchaeota archaeon]|nr:hypothetical protein [Nanoarchaeota archaeon]